MEKAKGPIAIGALVSGRYSVERELGHGGFGIVYVARDQQLYGKQVVIKALILKPGDQEAAWMQEKFNSEIKALSMIGHPGVVGISDAGKSESGAPFLVMDYIEGCTLRTLIAGGRIEFSRVASLIHQIAGALTAAHAKGVVHRDLKPENVMVQTLPTGEDFVRLIDFGIASIREAARDSIETVVAGTIKYMAPEQLQGRPVAASDVYALGVIAYEMVTGGNFPFSATSPVHLYELQQASSPQDPRELAVDLPEGAAKAILQALRFDAALRPTAQELASAVSPVAFPLPPSSQAPSLRGTEALESHESTTVRATSASPLIRDPSSAPPTTDRTTPVISKIEIRPAITISPKRWKMLGLGALAVLALLAAAYVYNHRRARLTDKDTLVLAEFTNATGDAVFDGTLRQGLAIQLEQSPFLSLVSDERIHRMLSLMGQPRDARLTPALAREICERLASAAVLEGSIASLGSQYVLGLRANNCRSGDVLDEEQMEAAKKEEVLNTLTKIARKFRARVGESLATVQRLDTPLAEATTPSLEALKAYSMGWRVISSTGAGAALPLFKRATEIDPKFAMAHAWLGRMYGDVGEAALSAQSTTTAYQLRERASDRERFFISVAYDTQVTENLEKAQQTCQLWIQTYPREAQPHDMLAGIIYPVLGKSEQALEEARRAIDLDPDFAIGYSLLAKRSIDLGRLLEADKALQQASQRKLEIPNLLFIRYELAFLRRDTAGMGREAALARGKSGVEDEVSTMEAAALANSGHLQQSRTMARHAVDLAQQTGQFERAALFEAGAALREAFFGNWAAAKQNATATLKLSNDRGAEYGAALALAIAGDSFQSQTLANDLERRYAEDTSVRFSYLPVLRAQIALNRGSPPNAIEQLRSAAAHELSHPRSSIHAYFGALYPIYVRGEAFLAAHEGDRAAAEFQKILDHREIVGTDAIGALVRVQIGRAFALSGEKQKAKAAYQDFLTLWKDADPDVPILKQAKLEYMKL